MAEQHTWKAVVGLTANEDMHSKLAAHNANTQAEAVRMIGINFSDYGVPIIDPSTIASDAIDAMRENLGNAGDIYVRYIVTHQKEIADQFAKTQNKLAVLLPEAEYRFFRSHATCTLVAAKILIDLGIVEFNYELLWNFTVKMLTNLTNIVTTNNMTNPNDAISRMIRELSQRVLVTYEYRDLRTDSRGPEDVISRPIGSVVGRRILGSNNYKDSKYVGRLFIAKKEFVDWCAKNRMEPKSLLDYAQSQKWLVPWADKFNMGRGTAHSTGSCSCYVLDYSAMEGAVEKTSGPAASNVKDIVVASNG
jgi:hypothetical protein